MLAGVLSLFSAFFLTGHSLSSQKYFKNQSQVSPFFISVLSLAPAFVLATALIPLLHAQPTTSSLFILFIKGCLYSVAFLLRFYGLKNFGAFLGALLICAQPPFVALCSYILLAEPLNLVELITLFTATTGLLLLVEKKSQINSFKVSHIPLYLILPAILMAIATVLDKKVLITGVSPSDFYILDKCLLLPSFLLTIGLLQPKELKLTFSKIRRNLIPYKAMLLLGFFWLTSSALYGFALSLEKTTIVFIIRNLSYPLAAIIGAFWFKEHITLKRAIGFALITLSAVLGVLF